MSKCLTTSVSSTAFSAVVLGSFVRWADLRYAPCEGYSTQLLLYMCLLCTPMLTQLTIRQLTVFRTHI